MAAVTLDKSKPYGTIFGIHEYGGVFEQGGKCFNGAGNEVGPGITATVAEPKRPGAAGPAPTEPTPAPDTEAALKELHPAQIKKLVEEAGITPATGAGSKKENIKILLAAEAG